MSFLLRKQSFVFGKNNRSRRLRRAGRAVETAADFDLRFLSGRKIQVADIVGNEQHLLYYRCYVKQTHWLELLLVKFLKKAGKRFEIERFCLLTAFIFLRSSGKKSKLFFNFAKHKFYRFAFSGKTPSIFLLFYRLRKTNR